MPIDPTMAASLVNGASGLIGTAIGAYAQNKFIDKQQNFDKEQSAIQRDWNEAMADKQNAWNLEQWNRENEYNTPSAQVQRLRDAGLNPMFYGIEGSNAGQVSAAQPLGYERASAGDYANPLSAGLDAAVKIAQVSNIQADTAKKGEETLTEVQRREQIMQECENAKQALENMKSQKGLTESQKKQIDENISWIERLNQATIAEKEANSALSKAQKNRIDELLEGEKILQSKSAEDFKHKWSKIDSEIKKMSKETGILEKDIENYAINHAQNGFMGTGLSLVNLLRVIRGQKSIADQNTDYGDSGSIANTYGNND